MRAKIYMLMLAVLSISMTGCFDDAEDLTQISIDMIEAYLAEEGILQDAIKTENGTFVVIETETNGKKAAANLVLETSYHAYVLDTSAVDGEGNYLGIAQNYKFLPDSGIFSLGFSEAMLEMKEGELADFYVPSGIPAGASPGPTSAASSFIPGNAAFKYEARLVKIRTLAEQNAFEDSLINARIEPIAKLFYDSLFNGFPAGVPFEDLVTKLDSGVVKVQLIAGDTLSVTENSLLSLQYTGYYLDNDVIFDETTEPLSVELDTTTFVKGFTEGLLSMKQKERSLIFIPSKVGYGAMGSSDGAIPPFEPLYFDIYIEEVE